MAASDRHGRRRRNEPTPEQVAEAKQRAYERLVEHEDAPLGPGVGTLRTLQRAEEPPHALDGGAVIESFKIRSGDPQHGAHRSDPHVSRIEAIVPVECPECGHDSAVFEYSAFHFISGSRSTVCRRCNHTIDAEDWS
jgi:hypothetical protein